LVFFQEDHENFTFSFKGAPCGFGSATLVLWSRSRKELPLAAMRLISCLAETNRTPFDFAEGALGFIFFIYSGGV
jgi:hypothetical protein